MAIQMLFTAIKSNYNCLHTSQGRGYGIPAFNIASGIITNNSVHIHAMLKSYLLQTHPGSLKSQMIRSVSLDQQPLNAPLIGIGNSIF